jgi:hypothetical protein
VFHAAFGDGLFIDGEPDDAAGSGLVVVIGEELDGDRRCTCREGAWSANLVAGLAEEVVVVDGHAVVEEKAEPAGPAALGDDDAGCAAVGDGDAGGDAVGDVLGWRGGAFGDPGGAGQYRKLARPRISEGRSGSMARSANRSSRG